MNNFQFAGLQSDWQTGDDAFLDSIFNLETSNLLSDFVQGSPESGDVDLNSDLMDICKNTDSLFNGLNDFSAYDFKEQPIFSSGASDSGLSSDNLDV